jgi:hypothetical protein
MFTRWSSRDFFQRERLLLLGTEVLLLVAELGGLLEVLLGDRILLLGADALDLLRELLDLRRAVQGLDAGAGAGLVHDVDRLVGEEPAGDVAIGELGGDLECLVGVDGLVVVLVLDADALEDGDGVLDGGRLDLHVLEAAVEGGVLLDVLAVLVERGGADAVQLAAGERRLEDVGGIHRALGRTGADDGVKLVDEDDDVLCALDLVHHALMRSSNWRGTWCRRP